MDIILKNFWKLMKEKQKFAQHIEVKRHEAGNMLDDMAE